MSERRPSVYEEPSSLPNAAETESALKPHDLEVLRRQYQREWPFVSTQTKFNYAWGLVKSRTRSEQQDGVKLLSEIYRESPERRRECLYYLALGLYKLGSYSDARRYNDLLLDKEPDNIQARHLQALIDHNVTRGIYSSLLSLLTSPPEGYFGMAIIGSLLALGGLVIGTWARRRK
ncbi:uncharacterized protein T551_01523 [Pneumocystis jirovecii RU7]|uniref:Mitochondrial fission 1 protein n=1 Tax=Pneumocystis jirovecii (strain RU7) TaxID=1408657 RepID=A0A0W4ZRG1_PNEJ7|nr:uncharacterized protein T551_01523 [Pneumocystis jirovecii RU7]KTW30971.1 hypothetical protein T551_01523 [Pneumocystis jirovecii RU7]